MNCGACGLPGCAEYASALLKGEVALDQCKPGGIATATGLAVYFGKSLPGNERRVALVRCNGDESRTRGVAVYNGIADCRAAQLVGGSGKACRFGCMGFGSCAHACPVQAIEIRLRRAIVHPDLCIGCGKCVAICPRRLIRLVPESAAIHVLCSNHDRGIDVRRVCDVGCVGCGLCVRILSGRGMHMEEGSLAIVDYDGQPPTDETIIARCPSHTLVKRPGNGDRGAVA
jgi:electron transport complex protein RnfB